MDINYLWVTLLSLLLCVSCRKQSIFGCDSSQYPNSVQWKIVDGGNDHHYEAIILNNKEEKITWEEALEAANQRGGNWYLATVTSKEEDEFIKNLFQKDTNFFNCCHLQDTVYSVSYGPWIGAASPTEESNDFYWVTLEPFTYEGWGPFEPFGNGDRMCYSYYSFTEEVGWNDIPSEFALTPNSYILECFSESP